MTTQGLEGDVNMKHASSLEQQWDILAKTLPVDPFRIVLATLSRMRRLEYAL